MVRRRLLVCRRHLGLRRSCARAAEAEILIGVAGPMTGVYAWAGERYQRGAALAVEDLNAKGGVLGQQVELIVGDDFCDADQAVALARKLVSDGVVFVAGHWCSHASIPASKVYEEAGILHDRPGLGQREADRRRRPERVPRVRPGRPARGRWSPTTSPSIGRTRRSRSWMTVRPGARASPTGSRRRLHERGVTVAMDEAYHPRRSGVFRAGLEDAGRRRRCPLPRRLSTARRA